MKTRTIGGVIACGLVLIAMYSYEHWPHSADVKVFGPTLMPEIMSAGKDTPTRIAPTPQTPSRTPNLDKLSKLTMYDRLARSKDPRDAKAAYDLVRWCKDNQEVATQQPEIVEQARQECGDLTMRPGILDPHEQLKLAKVAAEAGVHGAYMDVFRYHVVRYHTLPPGAETDAYIESLRQVALSTADPYALAEEESRAKNLGDKPAELAMYVASRAAYAKDRGVPYDPATDGPTRERAGALPQAVASEAIAKGTQFVALNYRSMK